MRISPARGGDSATSEKRLGDATPPCPPTTPPLATAKPPIVARESGDSTPAAIRTAMASAGGVDSFESVGRGPGGRWPLKAASITSTGEAVPLRGMLLEAAAEGPPPTATRAGEERDCMERGESPPLLTSTACADAAAAADAAAEPPADAISKWLFCRFAIAPSCPVAVSSGIGCCCCCCGSGGGLLERRGGGSTEGFGVIAGEGGFCSPCAASAAPQPPPGLLLRGVVGLLSTGHASNEGGAIATLCWLAAAVFAAASATSATAVAAASAVAPPATLFSLGRGVVGFGRGTNWGGVGAVGSASEKAAFVDMVRLPRRVVASPSKLRAAKAATAPEVPAEAEAWERGRAAGSYRSCCCARREVAST